MLFQYLVKLLAVSVERFGFLAQAAAYRIEVQFVAVALKQTHAVILLKGLQGGAGGRL